MDLKDFRKMANEVAGMVDDINALRKIREENYYSPTSKLPSILETNEDELLDKIKEHMQSVELITSIFEQCMELVPKKLQLLDNEVAKKMLSYGNIGLGFRPWRRDRDTTITTEELNENEKTLLKNY